MAETIRGLNLKISADTKGFDDAHICHWQLKGVVI